LEECLEIPSRTFAAFSAIEKALEASEKAQVGRMLPAGSMLCKPGLLTTLARF